MSRPGLQGTLLAILFAFVPFLAQATTDADMQLLLSEHNKARQQASKPVPALCLNQQLITAAERHCQDMLSRGYFDHYAPAPAPYGTDPDQRMRAAGYPVGNWAENIAWGQRSVAEVMQDWENSSGHYANIVSPYVQEVGFARCGANNYWVADFAAPTSGGTHCITNTTTTTTSATPSATTSTTAAANAAAKAAGLATYNSCKKYLNVWHLDAAKGLYFIFWTQGATASQNGCYKFDPTKGTMSHLVLDKKTGVYRFVAS